MTQVASGSAPAARPAPATSLLAFGVLLWSCAAPDSGESHTASSEAGDLFIVGTWEDATSDTAGGQLPGGQLWEFRRDGTYVRVGSVMLDEASPDVADTPPRENIDDDCFRSLYRAANGLRSGRIFALHDRGGTYDVEGDVLSITPRRFAGGKRLDVRQEHDRVHLTDESSGERHELRRVGWYRLPPEEAFNRCSESQR